MAMLIQYLSAKLGIATGKNLPELCRERFPRATSVALWVQAEIIAMATDLAEFVGAAIALNLLFGVPLFPAGLITAVVAFAILGLQTRGYRRFELVIGGMLGGDPARASCTRRFASAGTPRASPKGSCRASRARTPCCWPPASWAPRSCRT